MNKQEGRYKVAWDGGGVDWCSYTDDKQEAIEECKKRDIESENHCLVIDQTTNEIIIDMYHNK